ncbi:MAG TPA: DUF4252 domain-containing protein [Cyclobacteriaceae bacterium]|nr:DUF4252 domain-containing protein [Cyclobacteriaceae bacterium]
MKKLAIGVVMMVFSAAVQAQDNAISRFFSKYQNDESFSQVTVSSKMFGLFTNMDVEKPEDKEVLDAISKIKGLRILGKQQTRDSRALYKEAMAMIPQKEYEELLTVRDKDKDMKFFIKEAGGKIGELVMVMGGNEEFMVLSIFGEIDLKQVSKIGRKMDIDGLRNLEKVRDKHKEGDKDKDKDKDNTKDNKKE